MTSAISPLVRICHSYPGCSFTWNLRVVYFSVKSVLNKTYQKNSCWYQIHYNFKQWGEMNKKDCVALTPDIFIGIYICYCLPGGPYWEKLFPKSCVRTEAIGLSLFILVKLLSALLVTNSLLSAGGQDGKIPPAHEPIRLQDSFFLPACAPKKK